MRWRVERGLQPNGAPFGPRMWIFAVLIVLCIVPGLAAPEQKDRIAAPSPPASRDAKPGDAAAALFESKCASCHSVGGQAIGDSPDLLPATRWPVADLKTAIVRMQKNVGPLSEAEVNALADLLRAQNVRQRLEAERQRREARQQEQMEPPSAARGQALFFGKEALSGGGMACSSCHKAGANGGSLAVDLTHVSGRRGGAALRAAIIGANFPVMRPAYANKPVTAQEAADLTKFLETVHAGSPVGATDPPPAGPARLFGWVGALLACGGLVGMGLGLRRFDRAGTRARLVRKSTRSKRS